MKYTQSRKIEISFHWGIILIQNISFKLSKKIYEMHSL